MSDPIFSAADLRQIIANPYEDGRLWSMHGIGMLRTYLDPERRWRLNIWHRALLNPGISTIHTHPWPFTSYVVLGELQNQRFVRCTHKSVDARLFNEGKITCGISNGPSTVFPGLNGDPEIVTLHANRPETYGPGDTYCQRPEEIHDTRARDCTVTVIERGPEIENCEASVFWPVGTAWGDASREFDPALATRILCETLRRYGPSPIRERFAPPTGNWMNGR